MNVIIIKNRIEDIISDYQEKTGASKVWIAKQLGISRSRLYQLCNADNMMVDVALRFAEFFSCDVKELFEYKTEK